MKLQVKDLSYQYESKGREIFSHFNMEAEQSERVGLIAPSGFGKTTLCKLMAGYLLPAEGDVLLEGKPLREYRGYCPVQLIWQQPELAVNPRLRMRDVLAEAGDIDERVLRELGIKEEWLSRFPSELSGGELQRFCIARALGLETKFLIADEISTMLDMITQSQIWHFLIAETKRRGIGLISVSHDRKLLEAVCTRQIELTQTRIG